MISIIFLLMLAISFAGMSCYLHYAYPLEQKEETMSCNGNGCNDIGCGMKHIRIITSPMNEKSFLLQEQAYYEGMDGGWGGWTDIKCFQSMKDARRAKELLLNPEVVG
jgi:hypothetical protein